MSKNTYTAVTGYRSGGFLQNDPVKLHILSHFFKMDGFAVIEEIRKNGWLKKIPVLVISGEKAVDVENQCFQMGISDFIHKPFEASIVKNRVKNAVELFTYKNQLEQEVERQTEALEEQSRIIRSDIPTASVPLPLRFPPFLSHIHLQAYCAALRGLLPRHPRPKSCSA